MRAPMKWNERDAFALTLLTPFLAPRTPLTAWSLCPSAIVAVANATDFLPVPTDSHGYKREHIVLELGGGASSLILGRRMRAADEGALVAVESDAGAAQRLERWSREEMLPIEVVHAPIVERPGTTPWYELAAIERALGDERPSVLVVDGPVGFLAPRARMPALELLPRLAEHAAVLLDDTDRADEQALLVAMREALPGWTWQQSDGVFAIGVTPGVFVPTL